MILRDSDISFQGALWGDEEIPEGSLVVMADEDAFGDVVPLRMYDPLGIDDSVSMILGVTLNRARYLGDPISVGNRPGALYAVRVAAPSRRGETIGPSLSTPGQALSLDNPIMNLGVSLGETSPCSNGDAMARALWLGTANAGLSASTDYATLSVGRRLIALFGEGTDGVDGVFPIIAGDTPAEAIYLGDSNNPWSTLFSERLHLGQSVVYDPPSLAAGAASGTGSTPTLGTGATNSRGTITITAGTSPGVGAQLVLTYGNAWPVISGGANPKVVLTPANASAAAVQAYVQAVAAGFTVSFGIAPVNGTSYTFNYFVCG